MIFKEEKASLRERGDQKQLFIEKFHVPLQKITICHMKMFRISPREVSL